MISRYTTERGIEIENQKSISTVELKNQILAVSLKSGELLIYEILLDKIALLQNFDKIEKNSLFKKLSITHRIVKLSENARFMFTGSIRDGIKIFIFDDDSKKFKLIFNENENKGNEINSEKEIKLNTMDWTDGNGGLLATGGIFSKLRIFHFSRKSSKLQKIQEIDDEITLYRKIKFSGNGNFLVVDGEMENKTKLGIYKRDKKGHFQIFKKFYFERTIKQKYSSFDPIEVNFKGSLVFRGTKDCKVVVYQISPDEKDFCKIETINLGDNLKASSLNFCHLTGQLMVFTSKGIMKGFIQKKFLTAKEDIIEENFTRKNIRTAMSLKKDLDEEIDPESFEESFTLRVHEHLTTHSCYDQKSGRIVSGSLRGEIKIQQVQELAKENLNLKGFLMVKELDINYEEDSKIMACEYSKYLETIFMCSDKGDYKLLARNSNHEYSMAKSFKKLDKNYDSKISLDVSIDGRYAAYAFKNEIFVEEKFESNNGSISFKEIGKAQIKDAQTIHQVSFFLSDPSKFATCGDDEKIKIWKIDDQKLEMKQELSGHEGTVTCFNITSKGDVIISAGKDKKIKIWVTGLFSFGSFGERYSLETQNGEFTSIYITPNKEVIIAAINGKMEIFKMNKKSRNYQKTASHFINEKNHNVKVEFVYFTPSGQLLIIDSEKVTSVWFLNIDHLVPLSSYAEMGIFFGMSLTWQWCLIIRDLKKMEIFPLNQPPSLQDKYTEMNYFKKLFEDDKYFISKKALKNLIQYVKKESIALAAPKNLFENLRVKIPKEYGELDSEFLEKNEVEEEEDDNFISNSEKEISIHQKLFIHSKASIQYLCVISGYDDLLKESLELFGYFNFFYKREINPIKTAFELNSQNILDVFADYLHENQNVLEALFNMKMFSMMMKSSSPKLQDLGKDCFFGEGRASDIKIAPLYPISEKEGYVLIDHYSSQRDLKFRNHLIKQANIKENTPSKIEFMTLPFPANFNLWSKFCTEYLDMMKEVPEYQLTSELRFIVREIWKRNKIFTWSYFLINWTHMLLVSVQIVWFPQESPLFILTFFLNFFLLFYEIMVMFTDFKEYFSSFFNWVDLFEYISVPIAILQLFRNKADDYSLNTNAFYNLVLFVCLFRSLTLLQIFDRVRYMIAMIVQVFKDMTGFLSIYVSSILAFAVVHTNSLKTVGKEKFHFVNFLQNEKKFKFF